MLVVVDVGVFALSVTDVGVGVDLRCTLAWHWSNW